MKSVWRCILIDILHCSVGRRSSRTWFGGHWCQRMCLVSVWLRDRAPGVLCRAQCGGYSYCSVRYLEYEQWNANFGKRWMRIGNLAYHDRKIQLPHSFKLEPEDVPDKCCLLSVDPKGNSFACEDSGAVYRTNRILRFSLSLYRAKLVSWISKAEIVMLDGINVDYLFFASISSSAEQPNLWLHLFDGGWNLLFVYVSNLRSDSVHRLSYRRGMCRDVLR